MSDPQHPRDSVGPLGPHIRARPFLEARDRSPKLYNILTPEEQAQLRRIASVLEIRAAGVAVYAEGEKAHFLYVLDKGLVRISRHIESGQRQILAFMFPGDLFGLAEDGRYVNSAETIAAATVYRLPFRELRRLMTRDPQLPLHLLIKAVHDLRAAQRQLIVLGQFDVRLRLASFLTELCQHLDFYDAARHVLKIPMNRFDVADYLGTSPESIARAFGKLERDRIVRRSAPRTIELLQPEELARLAHGHMPGSSDD